MKAVIFRISVFGNYSAFAVTPSNIVRWIQFLQEKKYELLPRVIRESQMLPVQNGILPSRGTAENRIQFVSDDNTLLVRILANRIDVEITNQDVDNYKIFLKTKLQELLDLLKTVMAMLGDVKVNRIAYYTDFFIREVDSDKFEKFYSENNFDINISDNEKECVEWSHYFNKLSVLELLGRSEDINNIFKLESTSLNIGPLLEDSVQFQKGLRILADINTKGENTEERFTTDSLDVFFEYAQKVFIGFVGQMRDKLGL